MLSGDAELDQDCGMMKRSRAHLHCCNFNFRKQAHTSEVCIYGEWGFVPKNMIAVVSQHDSALLKISCTCSLKEEEMLHVTLNRNEWKNRLKVLREQNDFKDVEPAWLNCELARECFDYGAVYKQHTFKTE